MQLRLNTHVSAADILAEGFDEVLLATGIVPRTPDIPGIGHRKVLSYLQAIAGHEQLGRRVAVIGAGGIGFDVAELLTHAGEPTSLNVQAIWQEWGIDTGLTARGGVAGVKPEFAASAREVYLLQRKSSKVGAGLGKTTGWIHRADLTRKQVQMLNSVEYLKIDDAGLHIRIAGGEPQLLDVDHVVICAGQDPQRELLAALEAAGQSVQLIGGADVAVELDAKRAIDQGSRVAAAL